MALLDLIASGGQTGPTLGETAIGLEKLKMQQEELGLKRQTVMSNLQTLREKKQQVQQKQSIISSSQSDALVMGGTEAEQENNFAQIAISRAKATGDLDLVKELQSAYKTPKKEKLFALPNRKEYTDESAKTFEQTGKASDLRIRPEVYASKEKKLGPNQHLLPNGEILTTSEIRAAMDEDFPKTSQQELILLQAMNPQAYVQAKAANLDRPRLGDYAQEKYGIDITGRAPQIKPGKGFADLPPASQHEGKTVKDKHTGQLLISDGVNWVPK